MAELEGTLKKIAETYECNTGRAIVKLDAKDEKTKGGIIVPETAAEDRTKKATVICPGRPWWRDSSPTSLYFEPGDRIVVDNVGLIELKLDGEDLVLIRLEDVIALEAKP